jgi:hypothetical protein
VDGQLFGNAAVPAGQKPGVPEAQTKLDAWLDLLAWKESNNNAKIRVVDTNGRYSYGCLQFQMATFKAFMTRYGIAGMETPPAMWETLIYDCSVQKSLAKVMIQNDPVNAWKNWAYTVHHKTGMPPADLYGAVVVTAAAAKQ